MKTITAAIALAMAATTQTATAQSFGPPPAEVRDTLRVLPAGTRIDLRMAHPVSTNEAGLFVGRRFFLQVVHPVMLDDQVVIPAGSTAMGEVTFVKQKGNWGKSGSVSLALTAVSIGGEWVGLSGNLYDNGTTGAVGIIAASLVTTPLVGFIMSGTSATVREGTFVKGFTDHSITLVTGDDGGVGIYHAPRAPKRIAAYSPTDVVLDGYQH